MKVLTAYIVAEANGLVQLESKVMELSRAGYVPQGGLIYAPKSVAIYKQAMAKYKSKFF